MNPYRPLFSKSSDIAIAWVIVVVWILVGTFLLRLKDLSRHRSSESYCWPAGRAFLWLCVFFATISIIGLIFLAWLRITSSFWVLWQLLWVLSIICIFRVLPFIAMALVGWALSDLWRHGARVSSTFIAIACPVALALDTALYFAVEMALQR